MADINQGILDARNYADSAFATSNDLLHDAASIARGHFDPAFPTEDKPELDRPDFEDPGTAPEYNKRVLRLPVIDGLPDFIDPQIVDGDAYQNAVELPSEPTVVFRDAPGISPPDAPDAPRVDTNLTLPDEPDLLTIQPPSLITSDPDSIAKPVVNLPTFDLSPPDPLASPPDNLADQYLTQYREMLPEMQAEIDAELARWTEQFCADLPVLRDNLCHRINSILNGSERALTDQYEQALYDRVRDRTAAERVATEERIRREAANAGFGGLPSGALNAALQRAQQDGANNNARAAIEVYIARSERELQHLQFVMNLANQLQNQALTSAIAYMAQLLQRNQIALAVAKQTVDYAVEVYNLLVKKFEADLDRYQAIARVLEIEARFSLVAIDLYKAELDAERLKEDINQARVALYRAQIEAEDTKLRQYTAALSAIELQIQVRKLPLDVFESEVRAYEAQIRGDSLALDVYRAAQDGDRTNVALYSEQIAAHRARSQALRDQAELRRAAQQDRIDFNRLLQDRYRSSLDKASIEADLEKTEAGFELEAYKTQLAQYESLLRYVLGKFNAELTASTTETELNHAVFRDRVQYVLRVAQQANDRIQQQAQLVRQAGEVAGNLAAAALSSQNTLLSESSQTISSGA